LYGAELQLLYGSFAAAEFAGNVANAAFFGEAHLKDAALVLRKLRDKPEQGSATFDDFVISGVCGFRFGRRFSLFSCGMFPAIHDRVRRDSK
jgi:hypothetical protein